MELFFAINQCVHRITDGNFHWWMKKTVLWTWWPLLYPRLQVHWITHHQLTVRPMVNWCEIHKIIDVRYVQSVHNTFFFYLNFFRTDDRRPNQIINIKSYTELFSLRTFRIWTIANVDGTWYVVPLNLLPIILLLIYHRYEWSETKNTTKKAHTPNSRRTKVNRRKCDHVQRIRALFRCRKSERDSRSKVSTIFYFGFLLVKLIWRWNYMRPTFASSN